MSSGSLSFGFLLVYFVYGLAFFSMGLVMMLETRRSPLLGEARLLVPLAVFGIVHGLHEWAEMFLLFREWFNLPVLPGIAWGRLALLIISFSSLLYFGFQALRPERRRLPAKLVYIGVALLVAYLGLAFITGITQRENLAQWISHADAYARYLLAVPAAALAGLGLIRQSQLNRQGGRLELATGLQIAAWSFVAYSLTQIIVSPTEISPARFINTITFYDRTGIPIQVFRAAAAILVTLGLMRSIEAAEEARREQLAVAQRARMEALEQIHRDFEEREILRRELLRHIVIAQEDERARIARELHDETAQFLTALSLDLATLKNANLPDRRIGEIIDRLQSLSRQMSQGIYHLVRDLRPAQLDDLGLTAALQYLADEEHRNTGLQLSVEIIGSPKRLDPLIETVLFRVAQEAVSNVDRHAHSDMASLQLDFQPDQVVLRVRDEGIGFDTEEELHPPRGWGIAGMRERCRAVGGSLRLESSPGEGTMVEVIVPLPQGSSAEFEENGHESDPLIVG